MKALRVLYLPVLALTGIVVYSMVTSPATAASPSFHQLTHMQQLTHVGAALLPLAALTLLLLVKHNRNEAASAGAARGRAYRQRADW